RAECEAATIGRVSSSRIIVSLSLDNVLSRVPAFLFPEEALPEAPKTPLAGRKSPVQLVDLHRQESVYRLIPPEGCELQGLPKGATVYVGPATLSWEFTKEKDGVIAVRYSFDTGRGNFSLAEARALVSLFAELAAHDYAFVFSFQHTVSQLSDEG